jgi:uncharacterized protein with GYD domain
MLRSAEAASASGRIAFPGNGDDSRREETTMATFIVMLNWTDQGIRSLKDTPKRVQAARDLAKKFGVELKQIFLTSGEFDILVITEAPHYDNVAKYAMAAGAQGNVRSRTVRGWTEAEMFKLIAELP